jgi:hypothetical protein
MLLDREHAHLSTFVDILAYIIGVVFAVAVIVTAIYLWRAGQL